MKRKIFSLKTFLIAGVICLIGGITTDIIIRNVNTGSGWGGLLVLAAWAGIEQIFVVGFVGFAVAAGIMAVLKKETKEEP